MNFTKDLSRTAKLAKLGFLLKKLKENQEDATEQKILAQMASLRGLPQKVGQLLGLRSSTGSFIELTESSQHSVSSLESFSWIEKETGQPLSHTFSEIDPKGIAASLGQVHRARLHDGTQVAVKIQYPHVSDGIESDLRAIGWLASPLSTRGKGFPLASLQKVLRESLLRELDYLTEQEALLRFQDYLQDEDGVVIPAPVQKLTTPKLLVTEWLEGDSLRHASQEPPRVREKLSQSLIRFFLKSWLVWGEVHGDPHAGNYRICHQQGETRLGVLDFGCTQQLSLDKCEALLSLLLFDTSKASEELLLTYERLGFQRELLEPFAKKLILVTEILQRPFHAPSSFSVEEWNLSEEISTVLEEDRMTFRLAGPPSLLIFLRSFSGVVQLLQALQTPVHWRREFEAIIGNAVTRGGTSDLGENHNSTPQPSSLTTASHLCIAVEREGKTTVKLRFPKECLSRIESLIDPKLLHSLKEREISPKMLANDAIANGVPPGELFSLSDAERKVLVWLE
ncbi:AarF/ABC1/UbiB kinase family protein [bacterium]|nr:AarF/ABC1/UbiB kinase family protein [bacterium]